MKNEREKIWYIVEVSENLTTSNGDRPLVYFVAASRKQAVKALSKGELVLLDE
jgi:hypothetical protein